MKARTLIGLAVLLSSTIGCGPKDGRSAAASNFGARKMGGGVARLMPGPGNATADQRVGSKLRG